MSKKSQLPVPANQYRLFVGQISLLLETARRQAALSVNAILTATYWEIGRRIVEFEQGGSGRATYGERLVERLSEDLTRRFGKGFRKSNLFQMRSFYTTYANIFQTLSGKSTKSIAPENLQTLSGKSVMKKRLAPFAQITLQQIAQAFPLSWSHYVLLLSVTYDEARAFYEAEALRGGWSVRQLDRQISSQFYERTLISKNKAAMLKKGTKPKPGDLVTPEEETKDPYVLEFLGLKDEYSESDLEEALIQHLEKFLLELGGDFTFVAR